MKNYLEYWLGAILLVLSFGYFFSDGTVFDLVRFYGLSLAAFIFMGINSVKLHIDSKFNK